MTWSLCLWAYNLRHLTWQLTDDLSAFPRMTLNKFTIKILNMWTYIYIYVYIYIYFWIVPESVWAKGSPKKELLHYKNIFTSYICSSYIFTLHILRLLTLHLHILRPLILHLHIISRLTSAHLTSSHLTFSLLSSSSSSSLFCLFSLSLSSLFFLFPLLFLASSSSLLRRGRCHREMRLLRPFRMKWGSIVKNWAKIAIFTGLSVCVSVCASVCKSVCVCVCVCGTSE